MRTPGPARTAALTALAAVALAAPARANDAHADVRGGIYWSGGYAKPLLGADAGYDFDLAPMTFAGIEGSADKILDSGTDLALGVSGRIGAKVATVGRVYALGGYSGKPCANCADAWHLGAGYEHGMGWPLYTRFEFRHRFVQNGQRGANTLTAGVGVRF